MSKKKKYKKTEGNDTNFITTENCTTNGVVIYSSKDDYTYFDNVTSSKMETKIPYPIFRDYVLDCIKIKNIFTLKNSYLFWFSCENVSDTVNVSKNQDVDEAGNIAKNKFVDKIFHDDDMYKKLLGGNWILNDDDYFTVNWSGGLYSNNVSVTGSSLTGYIPQSNWGTSSVTSGNTQMSQSAPTSKPPISSSNKVTVTNQTTNQPFFSVDRSNKTLKTDYQFKNCDLSLTEHGDLTINYSQSESITLNLNGNSKTIRDHEGNVVTSQKKLTGILNKLLS